MKKPERAKTTNTPPPVIPALCAGVLTLSPCHALESEEVPFEELPEAVKAELESAAPGILVEEIELDTDDPELAIYEIEGEWDGQEVELEISALGDLLDFETEDDEEDYDDDEEEHDEDEDDYEESLAFEELPQNIAAIVQSLFPNLIPDEIERETEDGVTVYEIEGFEGADEVSVEIAESGEILELENSAGLPTVPGLPDVIQLALSESAPGAEIVEYQRKASGDHQLHAFEGFLNGQELELSIAGDGTVLSVDYEAMEDDDDDGEDHEEEEDEQGDYEEEEEQEIAVDQLPEAIQSAIASTYPSFHFREIEVETVAGEERYEVEGCLEDGQALELLFSPNGDLIRMEVDSDDDGLCDADEIEMGADPDDHDTDDDVFPDGFEVAQQSDPTNPDSQPQILSVSLAETEEGKAFDVCVETFASGTYQLEEIQADGSWVPVGDPFPGDGESCNVVVSVTESGLGLFRVVIRPQSTE